MVVREKWLSNMIEFLIARREGGRDSGEKGFQELL